MAEDAVAADRAVKEIIPDPPGGLTSYRAAARLALERQLSSTVTSSWDDDVTAGADPADSLPSDPEWAGHTVYTDVRERDGAASAEAVWDVIVGIGGENGWYSAPFLWWVRGKLDQAVGGSGLARGRRHPQRLEVGDHVDWWRVELVEPGRRLVLRSEMRASGRAWLELSVSPLPDGGARYRQRAVFFPSGVLGRLYWLAVLPFHVLIFPSMARNILRAAQSGGEPAGSPSSSGATDEADVSSKDDHPGAARTPAE